MLTFFHKASFSVSSAAQDESTTRVRLLLGFRAAAPGSVLKISPTTSYRHLMTTPPTLKRNMLLNVDVYSKEEGRHIKKGYYALSLRNGVVVVVERHH